MCVCAHVCLCVCVSPGKPFSSSWFFSLPSPPLFHTSEFLRGSPCSRWPVIGDGRGSFDGPEFGSPGSFAVSLSCNGFSRATAAGAARETAAAFEASATGWRPFGSLFMLSLNFKSGKKKCTKNEQRKKPKNWPILYGKERKGKESRVIALS